MIHNNFWVNLLVFWFLEFLKNIFQNSKNLVFLFLYKFRVHIYIYLFMYGIFFTINIVGMCF